MKIGGQIPWNATPICEMFKISFLMGRPHMRDVLGNRLSRPIIPFGSLVEYYTISAKDQSRIHQFGKKIFTWIVPRIRFVRGRIWSAICSKRLNAKEVIFPKGNGNFIFPVVDASISRCARC